METMTWVEDCGVNPEEGAEKLNVAPAVEETPPKDPEP